MTLVVDELYDGIVFEQPFRIQENISVAHIRPWIYKHQFPSTGSLTVEVFEGATLLKRVQLASSEINAQIPGTYAHGMIRFDTDPFQLNHNCNQEYTEFTMRIYMDGYTTDTQNFYGMIRRYELKFYETYGQDVIDGEAPNDMVEPGGFELFEYIYR